MFRGKMIFASVVLSSLLFTSAAFGTEKAAESWTGFVFRNGNTAKIDEGGPFKSVQECVAWGKGNLRGTDEFRCGLNCRKDSVGRPTCNRVEKDVPAVPSAAAETKAPSPAPTAAPAASAEPSPAASPAAAASAEASPAPQAAVKEKAKAVKKTSKPSAAKPAAKKPAKKIKPGVKAKTRVLVS